MTQITLQDGKIVLRDGKVGTEQACCCSQECCEIPLPPGMVPHISALITFPNVAGDCPAGEYAVEFDLVYDIGPGIYTGSAEIDLGGSIICCISFDLSCTESKWYGNANVFTGSCDQNGYDCTIGNGGFIGTGDTLELSSSVQDGVCLPSPDPVSLELALDVVYDFTLTFS